ncbi:LytTR family DNA-binding domain-containing protein [Lactobacillus johnsonii]|uniref:LytTR family transcriptional regulator n=2 Tax=Lactobacillus johnsonii TaxID=33959 RepID=A0A9X7XV07_LACJH|nr:LytTR family DNA-binding domain-containing protein [Lactobacillus johnsonii]AHA97754.1 hisitidine kinase [Lactobacillus johnsonii N6.2]QIA87993.1 LytTR family transcriptional regulator [Lactobacillus johnsonii]
MEIRFNIDQNLSKEKAEFWLKRMTTKVKRAVKDLQTEQEFLWGYQESEAYPIEFSQIYLIQVENEKTYICTKDGSYQFKGRLYQVKDSLPSDFIEASRSAIINYRFIDHLEIISNGNIDAVMKNGLRVQIARRKIKNLKERLGL